MKSFLLVALVALLSEAATADDYPRRMLLEDLMSLKSTDSMASQLSYKGASLHMDNDNNQGQMLLTLRGVGGETMIVENPMNPASSRSVKHTVVTNSLTTTPRFAVFLTNNSDTDGGNPAMQFVALNILNVVDQNVGAESITYGIELLHHDITNLTGTSGVVSPSEFVGSNYDFHQGMLMIDLTPAGRIDASFVDVVSDNDHSLKQLAYHHGMDYGSVPAPIPEGKVQGQGVFTTAFLGPFNAWAWACCAYKIPEHLLIGWVAPPSYVVLFLCCV